MLTEVAIKGQEDSAFTLRASQHVSVARPWCVFRRSRHVHSCRSEGKDGGEWHILVGEEALGC